MAKATEAPQPAKAAKPIDCCQADAEGNRQPVEALVRDTAYEMEKTKQNGPAVEFARNLAALEAVQKWAIQAGGNRGAILKAVGEGIAKADADIKAGK